MPGPERSGLTDERKQVKNIVVLTGAGMSAESGIPTFRDATLRPDLILTWLMRPKAVLSAAHLWADFDRAEMTSTAGWDRNPARVLAWYLRANQLTKAIRPNGGHRVIAGWQDDANVTVVTQNVDDLHERAGSRKVLHLHGSLSEFRCDTCEKVYTGTLPVVSEFQKEQTPPNCNCDGLIRPGAVWFGENLPQKAWKQAVAAVELADLLVVVGTSGLVHPAAGLPDFAPKDTPMVEVNPRPTPLSDRATISLREKASVALAGLRLAEYGVLNNI